ncbi:MAG: AAA family ATPase [Planctomycetota bacterium]|nr:AAA family ATPase [Planctomycetota bacterium]
MFPEMRSFGWKFDAAGAIIGAPITGIGQKGVAMDKGAHFYKTDFQVHSPRDRNWTAADGTTVPVSGRPTADGARLAFAQRLVCECRKLGITALAITDHHDMTFVPFFQLAAQQISEASASGIVLTTDVADPLRQDPVVFPGVEVTIAQPLCQTLVLLDAECLPETQSQLLEAIGVGGSIAATPVGPNPVAIDTSLDGLRDRIDKYASGRLKGRYIIIPHVTCPSAHKSILTTSTHNDYAKMHCVAGYIEKDWAEQTRKEVLDGRCSTYGNRALGVFQTSDSRREDFRYLGCRTTWVKMAEPTAEALRQACLARQSRIWQTPPVLPSRWISRIEVSDSTFMGTIDFEMNPQFNALVGGRGTGKSTILEYLRWAMQDQPVEYDSDINISDGVDRKRRLIQETLETVGAHVAVHWSLDGIPHVVRRNSLTKEITLQIGTEAAAPATAEDLRHLLPIRAYSQKQLSSVSIRTAELQRFVEQPIQEELAKLEAKIEQKRVLIRDLYGKILARKKVERDLSAARTLLLSARERANAIQKSLPKLKEESEKAITEHAARLRERQMKESLEQDLTSAAESMADTERTLLSLPQELPIGPDSPQVNILQAAHLEASELIAYAVNSVKGARKVLVDGSIEMAGRLKTWQANQEAHERAYTAAQEESAASKVQMAQLRDLRTQEAEKQKEVTGLEREFGAQADAEAEFAGLFDSWVELHRRRGDALEDQCNRLATMSDGEIRADLVRGADIEDALAKMKEAIKGAYISQDNWELLGKSIVDGGAAVEKWRTLMMELRPLAETNAEDLPPNAVPEGLAFWSLTDKQKRALVEKLQPNTWLDIALTTLRDVPRFFYKTADKEILFEKASAGQQATALLKVLLSEGGGPLIIDQPEEDLDNAVIETVVTLIWAAKQKRQIIFASHNANLVVNGDAELVVHCDYASDGDHSQGEIKHQGAIDVRDIRDVITKVMEGGEKAFNLRRQKYGF